MRYKLLFLVLLLEILLVSAATVRATDLRGGVVGPDPHTQVESPLVGVGVALLRGEAGWHIQPCSPDSDRSRWEVLLQCN